MSKTKRRAIATIHSLMRRPRWWNEAFAKYDQKRLRAWAAQQHAAALAPLKPHLTAPEPSFSDRVIIRELYKPHVISSKFPTVSTL